MAPRRPRRAYRPPASELPGVQTFVTETSKKNLPPNTNKSPEYNYVDRANKSAPENPVQAIPEPSDHNPQRDRKVPQPYFQTPPDKGRSPGGKGVPVRTVPEEGEEYGHPYIDEPAEGMKRRPKVGGRRCPLRNHAFGGLPGMGVFLPYTEYIIGAGRIVEAAHCLLGSLGEAAHMIERGHPVGESIRGEMAHAQEEMGIIEDVVEEYARPVYQEMINDPTPGYEEDAEKTVEMMVPVAQKLQGRVLKLYRDANHQQDLPKALQETALATYDLVLALCDAVVKAGKTYPPTAGNIYKDRGLRAMVWATRKKLDALASGASKQASRVWYHGSPKRFDQFQTRVEHTFGSGPSETPLFFTPDRKFAEMYAKGPEGTIYKVEINARKVFDGWELTARDRYWPPQREDMTPEGKRLYDDLANGKIFGTITDDEWHSVFGDSQGLLANILNGDYDVMESSEMKRWLRKQGYDAFYVSGDGPRNLAVFDPKYVKVLDVSPRRRTASGYYDWQAGMSLEDVIDRWRQEGQKLREDSMPVLLPLRAVWPLREYTWTRDRARGGYAKVRGKSVLLDGPLKWDAIKEDMSQRGWDPKSPAHLMIGRQGGAKLGEGNHRLAIARELGIQKVPVDVHFYSGRVTKRLESYDPVEVKPKAVERVIENMRERELPKLSPEEQAERDEQIEEIMKLLGMRAAMDRDAGYRRTFPSPRQKQQRGKANLYSRRYYRRNKRKILTQRRRYYRHKKNWGPFKRDRKFRREFPKRYKRLRGGGESSPAERAKQWRKDNPKKVKEYEKKRKRATMEFGVPLTFVDFEGVARIVDVDPYEEMVTLDIDGEWYDVPYDFLAEQIEDDGLYESVMDFIEGVYPEEGYEPEDFEYREAKPRKRKPLKLRQRPKKRQRKQRGVDKIKAKQRYRKNRAKYKQRAKKRYRRLKNNSTFKKNRKTRRKNPQRFKRRKGGVWVAPDIAFSIGRDQDLGYVHSISPLTGLVNFHLVNGDFMSLPVSVFLCSVAFLTEQDIDAMFELIDAEIGLEAYGDMTPDAIKGTAELLGLDPGSDEFGETCEDITGFRDLEGMSADELARLDTAMLAGSFEGKEIGEGDDPHEQQTDEDETDGGRYPGLDDFDVSLMDRTDDDLIYGIVNIDPSEDVEEATRYMPVKEGSYYRKTERPADLEQNWREPPKGTPEGQNQRFQKPRGTTTWVTPSNCAEAPMSTPACSHPSQTLDISPTYDNPGSAKVIPEGHDFVNKMGLDERERIALRRLLARRRR